MTIEATTERTIPPVTCASWCGDGDGHPHATYSADQWCMSEPREQRLALHKPLHLGDGTPLHDYMEVTSGRTIARSRRSILCTPPRMGSNYCRPKHEGWPPSSLPLPTLPNRPRR